MCNIIFPLAPWLATQLLCYFGHSILMGNRFYAKYRLKHFPTYSCIFSVCFVIPTLKRDWFSSQKLSNKFHFLAATIYCTTPRCWVTQSWYGAVNCGSAIWNCKVAWWRQCASIAKRSAGIMPVGYLWRVRDSNMSDWALKSEISMNDK